MGEFWVSFHIFFWFVLLPSSPAADEGKTELMFTIQPEFNMQSSKQSANFVGELGRDFIRRH